MKRIYNTYKFQGQTYKATSKDMVLRKAKYQVNDKHRSLVTTIAKNVE